MGRHLFLFALQQVWMHMKEIVEGFKQWFKVACYIMCAWWFLDFVKALPEPLAKRAMDKALSYLPF